MFKYIFYEDRMNMGKLGNTETVKKKETILRYYHFKGTFREKIVSYNESKIILT